MMKGKVLVIEDDINWQDNLRRFLEIAGFYVEIESNIEAALKKLQKDRFHFITIDMQLDEKNATVLEFEGWRILEIIKKLHLLRITPVMVITGFEREYQELKKIKKVEDLFFMGKGTFNRQEFINVIELCVNHIDLRFKDDHRGK